MTRFYMQSRTILISTAFTRFLAMFHTTRAVLQIDADKETASHFAAQHAQKGCGARSKVVPSS
jgi:hypothetical protein